MILPQLSPMHTRWDDPRKTRLCCHFFRLERAGTLARVRLQFLFTSRALIYMVRISWERQPLLLFSDVHRIGLESFQHFQTPTNGSVNKHNVQMGLPEGHSVLNTSLDSRCLHGLRGKLGGWWASWPCKIKPQATPSSTFPQPIAKMYLVPNKSSLDVAAGFATSVRADIVQSPNGCPKLI